MGLTRGGRDVPARSVTAVGIENRAVAVDLLRSVLRSGRPLDEAIASHADLSAMEGRDRAHVRLTVATVLRRLGQVDRVLSAHIRRPLPERSDIVQDILRVAVAQILYLRTPPHAAVHTAVELTERHRHHGLKGLVNAVLRRIAAQSAETFESAAPPGRINTPDWLYEAWASAYGETVAGAIADAHLRDALMDVTLKRASDAARYAEALEAKLLPTGSLRRASGGLVPDLPGYADGDWWIQDAASALPARLFGSLAGRDVIDLAAAPGGKAAQLAAGGARVTVLDRSAKRMERLEENFRRLNLPLAASVVADAARWRPAQPADAVLLDVPCTATGTIRRHPDVPYLKSAEDVSRLARTQEKLLGAAIDMTAPGGLIVYTCCSLQPEEGRDRIDAAIAAGAPIVREPVRPDEVGGAADLVSTEGDLRTLPCHLSEEGGMDGFFAARLRRTA